MSKKLLVFFLLNQYLFEEKKAKKGLSSKHFYIGAQLSEMAQVTEGNHLDQVD